MVMNAYSVDLAEAESRYRRYRIVDPFESIPPALLNSADVLDYIRVAGMVFPFVENEDTVKAASIEIPFLGTIYWWEGDERTGAIIRNGEKFTLRPNQIYFVDLSAHLHLP